MASPLPFPPQLEDSSPSASHPSHLSDEGMSDFPVIPLSRPKGVTHCSLLSIIALAWA